MSNLRASFWACRFRVGFIALASWGGAASGMDPDREHGAPPRASQPRTFENTDLFTWDDGQIVRSERYAETSSVFGDYDGDGDVDRYDYVALQICHSFSGPGIPIPPACELFDDTADLYVDLRDVSAFLLALTGPLSVVMVEAGELRPVVPQEIPLYYSDEPGVSGSNALNGYGAQAGYTQDDLWYEWSVIAQPAGTGDVIIANDARPATAYTLSWPLDYGDYEFHLLVTNLVTGEFGEDTVALNLVQCLNDFDCDDHDACSVDTCGPTNLCSNTVVDCDDGDACTFDVCDLFSGCNNFYVDCDDGLFCNGVEFCDASLGCQPGTEPCAAGERCDEDYHFCTTLGSSFTFTLNIDSLGATDFDDHFSAPLVFNPSTGTMLASLQTGDAAYGGAGYDRLEAMVNGGTITPLGIHEIENLAFTDFSGFNPGTHFVAKNVTGVNRINALNSNGTTMITGLTAVPADIGLVGIRNSSGGLSLSFAAPGVTSRPDDAMTISVIDTTAGTVSLTTPSGVTNGLETVTFVSDGPAPNALSALYQNTGTSLSTALVTGWQDLQLKELPSTIRTIDASTLNAGLTLGGGSMTQYPDPYSPSSYANYLRIVGGWGDDLFIFGSTLNEFDAPVQRIDGQAGYDVVQATFSSSVNGPLALSNIEEVRFNATNPASVNLSGVTGLTLITVEADGNSNSLTLQNMPGLPPLRFRGNGTDSFQAYDAVNYYATGVGGFSDALTIHFENRGVVSNQRISGFGVQALNVPDVETLTIVASDGPVTLDGPPGIEAGKLTTLNLVANSPLDLGTVTGTSAAVGTISALGSVAGVRLSCPRLATNAVVTLAAGDDSFSSGGSAGTAATILGRDGDDVLSGDDGSTDGIFGENGNDALYGGTGNDNLDGGPGEDSLFGGGGNDSCSGGTGADRFVFGGPGDAADTIVDFVPGSDKFDWNGGLSSIDSATTIPNFASFTAGAALPVSATILELTGTTVSSQTAANVVNVLGVSATNADINANVLFVIYRTGGGAAIWNWVNLDANVEASELTLMATLSNVATGALGPSDFP